MDSFWNPIDEMEALRRDFDELVSTLWPGGGTGRHSAFLPGRSARSYPLLNVTTTEEAVTVEALAPGLDPDSLEVTVARGVLTIAGEKSDHDGVAREAFHRRERASGRFVRKLHLDREIDDERVEAGYTDGILTVRLPRSEADVPRKIAVQVK
jgi:HSP20 family protein